MGSVLLPLRFLVFCQKARWELSWGREGLNKRAKALRWRANRRPAVPSYGKREDGEKEKTMVYYSI
jgi:hypothetical protein